MCIRDRHIIQNKFKIQQFFQKRSVKKIPEKILREKDPDLISFFNINTPQDREKAEKML